MKIIKKIIPGMSKNPFRKGLGAYEGVVAHATANTATALNEIKFMTGNHKNASVHFFVDWTGIYQCGELDYRRGGAGPVANQRYVHVELCETKDSKQWEKSYEDYCKLNAWILYQKRLGVTDGKTYVSHDWVRKNLGGTTHTDPIGYFKKWDLTWSQHVKDVKAAYDELTAPKVKKEDKEPVYRVQVGAFKDKANADAMAKQIKKETGIAVNVIKGE